jgi:hypothetical protein
MNCDAETASCSVIYIPFFMKICMGVPAILWFLVRNLEGCNVGIADGRNL